MRQEHGNTFLLLERKVQVKDYTRFHPLNTGSIILQSMPRIQFNEVRELTVKLSTKNTTFIDLSTRKTNIRSGKQFIFIEIIVVVVHGEQADHRRPLRILRGCQEPEAEMNSEMLVNIWTCIK